MEGGPELTSFLRTPRLTVIPGQWLRCQANGSNVCRVLRGGVYEFGADLEVIAHDCEVGAFRDHDPRVRPQVHRNDLRLQRSCLEIRSSAAAESPGGFLPSKPRSNNPAFQTLLAQVRRYDLQLRPDSAIMFPGFRCRGFGLHIFSERERERERPRCPSTTPGPPV